jgi:hypothetical protein
LPIPSAANLHPPNSEPKIITNPPVFPSLSIAYYRDVSKPCPTLSIVVSEARPAAPDEEAVVDWAAEAAAPEDEEEAVVDWAAEAAAPEDEEEAVPVVTGRRGGSLIGSCERTHAEVAFAKAIKSRQSGKHELPDMRAQLLQFAAS